MSALQLVEPGGGMTRGGSFNFISDPDCLLYFRSYAPTCDSCGQQVRWVRKSSAANANPKAPSYEVECGCGRDEIDLGFRLLVGGTSEWWRQKGGDW